MERKEFRELWQDNKHRPAFVRQNSEEIEEHTDLDEGIPEGSMFEVRQWLQIHKSVITRQLKEGGDSE